jgi:hypothetical protein
MDRAGLDALIVYGEYTVAAVLNEHGLGKASIGDAMVRAMVETARAGDRRERGVRGGHVRGVHAGDRRSSDAPLLRPSHPVPCPA